MSDSTIGLKPENEPEDRPADKPQVDASEDSPSSSTLGLKPMAESPDQALAHIQAAQPVPEPHVHPDDERVLEGPNRRWLLVILGVLLIGFGAMCLLGMIAGVVMQVFLMKNLPPDMGYQPPSLAMQAIQYGTYGVLGVGLMVLGIGSTMAKRWARNLCGVLFAQFAVMGVLMTIGSVFIMSGMMAAIQEEHGMQGSGDFASIMLVMQIVMLIMMTFFYAIIPGLFAWAFLDRSVARTCEFYQPDPDWTCRCPLTVLLVAIDCWMVAATYLLVCAGGMGMFFGVMLRGVVALVAGLLVGGIVAWIGTGIWKQRMWAWYAALVGFLVLTVSQTYSMMTMSAEEIYGTMGMMEEQMEALKMMAPVMGKVVLFGSCILTPIFLGYMWYIRRHFVGAQTAPTDDAADELAA